MKGRGERPWVPAMVPRPDRVNGGLHFIPLTSLLQVFVKEDRPPESGHMCVEKAGPRSTRHALIEHGAALPASPLGNFEI